MDLIEIIKQDYQNFPQNQSYHIYAEDVYFQDPLNKFTGVQKYKKMIGFLGNFFQDIDLQLHDISQETAIIKTEWTLKMTPPLPWQPRISILGWSELKLNQDNLIVSHIDRWHISPWSVLLQIFFWRKKGSQ
ncbi:MAG: hypothetical protein Tsb0014_24970 [Pleurocapsa sp.]